MLAGALREGVLTLTARAIELADNAFDSWIVGRCQCLRPVVVYMFRRFFLVGEGKYDDNRRQSEKDWQEFNKIETCRLFSAAPSGRSFHLSFCQIYLPLLLSSAGRSDRGYLFY